MKFTLCVLSMTILSITCSGQNNDWKASKLKGKPKSVTINWQYRYKKDGVNFTPWAKQYTTIYTFNTNGMYIQFRQLLANDSPSYRIAYSYDSKNLKGEQSYFDKNDKPTTRKITQYNKQWQPVELAEFNKDGIADGKYKYLYDAAGNNTDRIYYKPSGDVGSITTWKYNPNGTAASMKVETPGYASSGRTYSYDAQGNVIQESWIDGQNKVTFRFERKYDAQGNITEEVKFKEDSKPMDTVTWKYVYDKQGNWIKKTQYANDGADFSIEERVIVYY